jgi:hypothetical protein
MIKEVADLTGADTHTASLLAVRYLVKETDMSYQQVANKTGIRRDPLFSMWLASNNRWYIKSFRDMYAQVVSHFSNPQT